VQSQLKVYTLGVFFEVLFRGVKVFFAILSLMALEGKPVFARECVKSL